MCRTHDSATLGTSNLLVVVLIGAHDVRTQAAQLEKWANLIFCLPITELSFLAEMKIGGIDII